jgi:hypothetical protein
MKSAGYSGTPLAKKLGVKPGDRVSLLGAPAGFRKLLNPQDLVGSQAGAAQGAARLNPVSS